ncbi:hypothetical protein LEP1GSC052_2944 [Leptospira kmetyi serovar Malaysia str. Bejo-Iso9]|nr:hypothetical protein LEP1GSC052_2944 [Leptospira kmetyi serovar Malaysia str. Bejo-Iso9]
MSEKPIADPKCPWILVPIFVGRNECYRLFWENFWGPSY